MIEDSVVECYLVVRSNHEDRPRGEGGYYAYFNFEKKLMYFKKELYHELKPTGYSSRMNEMPIDFTPDKWHKITMAVKNVPNLQNVSLHATFDDKEIWGLDSGNIKCGDISASPINTGPAKWCFIRTNNPKGVKYRSVALKQI